MTGSAAEQHWWSSASANGQLLYGKWEDFSKGEKPLLDAGGGTTASRRTAGGRLSTTTTPRSLRRGLVARQLRPSPLRSRSRACCGAPAGDGPVQPGLHRPQRRRLARVGRAVPRRERFVRPIGPEATVCLGGGGVGVGGCVGGGGVSREEEANCSRRVWLWGRGMGRGGWRSDTRR